MIWVFWPLTSRILIANGVEISLLTENGIYWWLRFVIALALQVVVAKIGNKNRTKLINSAGVCRMSDLNGYKDWYLPSLEELELINKNLYSTGNLDSLDNHSCWSSSEYNSNLPLSGERTRNACSFHFKKPKSEMKYEKRLTVNSVLIIRSF